LVENGVQMTDLKTLIQKSDFISVNCTLNPTSYHLINKENLDWVKPDCILINTARGPIIDEQALIAVLQNHGIAGAALDVYEIEPLPESSPLKKMDNVLLAPHNSNSSPSAWERVHWNSIRNLLIGLEVSVDDFERIKLTNQKKGE